MGYTVDRFEGDLAILEAEDRTTVTVSRALLPEGCSEGDVLMKTADGYVRDTAEEAARKARIREKMRSLWN